MHGCSLPDSFQWVEKESCKTQKLPALHIQKPSSMPLELWNVTAEDGDWELK